MATTNFAGINEQVFILVPSATKLESTTQGDVTAGSYSNSVFRFLTSKWLFTEAVPSSTPPPTIYKQYTISLYHCQQLLFSRFEVVAFLPSVKCCLPMVSTYIFLIEKDAEQFAMCLSPLEKCLFRFPFKKIIIHLVGSGAVAL